LCVSATLMSNWNAVSLTVWHSPFLDSSNVADINFSVKTDSQLSPSFHSHITLYICYLFVGRINQSPWNSSCTHTERDSYRVPYRIRFTIAAPPSRQNSLSQCKAVFIALCKISTISVFITETLPNLHKIKPQW
jgi:hypothetical protein